LRQMSIHCRLGLSQTLQESQRLWKYGNWEEKSAIIGMIGSEVD